MAKNLSEINSLRDEILDRLEKGETFSSLAQVYSMDGNSEKGGDLGWISLGQYMKEFEKAIKTHQVGDIFKVDILENNWFYVVHKTGDNKKTKTYRYLKIRTCD